MNSAHKTYNFGEYDTIGDQGAGQYLDEELLSHYIDEDGNYSMLPHTQTPKKQEPAEATEAEKAVARTEAMELRRVRKPTPNAFRGPFDLDDWEQDPNRREE